MAYSIVKIALIPPPGTEYKVYWDEKKHNHGKSTATGTWAMGLLATHLGVPVSDLDYRASSFQSGQSKAPTGANLFEIS